MKRMIALSALLGAAFATASLSSAFAQSSVPGSTAPRPNKVTVVPPPPPPGGPDKFTTQVRPQGPGGRLDKPREHSIVDDIAGAQKPQAAVRKYKCYSNCNIFAVMCEDMGGGASTDPDGAVVCTVYD